jgi:hypothetical protein
MTCPEEEISSNITAPDGIGNLASISAASMQVEVSISAWAGRKKDKTATAQVTADNHAEVGAASVHKKLLGSCQELVAVTKFVANTRNRHYAMTLPWNDTGMRMITTQQYLSGYPAEMGALQTEFYRLVNVFLTSYDWEVLQAQARLGTLFNANDYPKREELESKFSFRINFYPIPESGDWRVDVGNEQLAELKSHYEGVYARNIKLAMDDMWRRVYDTLTHMSDRLDVDNNKLDKHGNPRRNTFHDSMVSNALEQVDMLKACNITNDPTMDRMARKLSVTFHGVTADQLRNNDTLREDTKQAVDEALKALPTLNF